MRVQRLQKILKNMQQLLKPLAFQNLAVFNLAEGMNVKEMEAKIADYKRNNADSIIRSEAKKVSNIFTKKLPRNLSI